MLTKDTGKADSELHLLEAIRAAEGAPVRLTQRAISRAAGLSLGMTNALVRQLADEGLVRLTRLSAKSVRYSLTPTGVSELGRRAARRLARAARNVEPYRERLEAFVARAGAEGATTLVLSGASEVDDILEHVCESHGLTFVKSGDRERALALARRPGVVYVTAEAGLGEVQGAVSLGAIISDGARRTIHE
jgi:DNA-binding MarR family transcriptional regulator